jgi:general secretion pathway protein D
MPRRLTDRDFSAAAMFLMKAKFAVTVVATIIILSGCAAQQAFRQGNELVTAGKSEEGLQKFRSASQLEPENANYRSTFLQTRDRISEQQIRQADALFAKGKFAEAEISYRRALSFNAANDRALAGLRRLDMHIRHEALQEKVNNAVSKKDFEGAKSLLRTILNEDPYNKVAENNLNQISILTSLSQSASKELSNFYRKPISITFRDAQLKQIVEVISQSSGLNILLDKDVKSDQKTSIFLKNSTVESALNFMLTINQLDMRVMDANTILIYPATADKQRDYQEVAIRSFYLVNSDAKTVANTLKTIVRAKNVVIDEKLNMLIVRDTPDIIKQAEKLVALHDVAEPEVMLEVEILEVSRSRLLDLGVQWPSSLTLTPLPIRAMTAAGDTYSTTDSSSLLLRDLRHQSANTLGASLSPLTINAKKDDSDANILANPRIRVKNREKAKVQIGQRVPNITTTATATGFLSESVNYIDVGLTLNVEPSINLDNDIAIKISLEVSNIIGAVKTKAGSTAYQIGTRNASTVLSLKDGETQVLAGLISNEERSSATKIPGLGEAPILGRLFGTTSDNNQKTEIVLSITPRLVRNIDRPAANLAQFPSGTESTFKIMSIERNPAEQNSKSGSGLTPNAGGEKALPGQAAVREHEPGKVNEIDLVFPANAVVGETFTVDVNLETKESLSALPVTIAFDGKILKIVNVAEGDFFKQSGASTSFASKVDPSGQLAINVLQPGKNGSSGKGRVATITFQPLTSSESSIIELKAADAQSQSGQTISISPVKSRALTIAKK